MKAKDWAHEAEAKAKGKDFKFVLEDSRGQGQVLEDSNTVDQWVRCLTHNLMVVKTIQASEGNNAAETLNNLLLLKYYYAMTKL